MGLSEQDSILEQEANEIIQRARIEVARNPKNHVVILMNQIATLSDINNERIAIIEKREEEGSRRRFAAIFFGLLAFVFGYLSKTSEEASTERNVYILLAVALGGMAGTLELITFRQKNLVDLFLFFLFSVSAVTLVLMIFFNLSERKDTKRNFIAAGAGLIGIISLLVSNKRKLDRESSEDLRRTEALGSRLKEVLEK